MNGKSIRISQIPVRRSRQRRVERDQSPRRHLDDRKLVADGTKRAGRKGGDKPVEIDLPSHRVDGHFINIKGTGVDDRRDRDQLGPAQLGTNQNGDKDK